MNKVIILGHPASGYGSVESQLLRCGMRPALPSRREGLTPKDIHQTLRKAHQIPESHTITDERGFFPVPIGPVWHGMAMDLMLGNLGREPWGWADPDTLFFLEYWRTLDPDSIFVMVYDSPASVFRNHGLDAHHDLDETAMRKHLDNWSAYNGTMLRFYFRNIDRCVLIHSRQLQGDSEYCLVEIQSKLSAPLDMARSKPDPLVQSALLPAADPDLAGSAAHSRIPPEMLCADTPTARFLIECQLERYPHHRGLYDELQAAANLPLDREESALTYSISAWISWLQERHAVMQGIKRMGLRCRENESTLERLRRDHQLSLLQQKHACEELEQILLENRDLKSELGRSTAEYERRITDLLRDLEQCRASEEVACGLLQENQKLKSEVERSREEYETSMASLRSDQQILLLQHAQACEELQQMANENRGLRIEVARLMTPVPDPEPPPPTGAAERVKRHLSYRLGSLIVAKARNPLSLVALPVMLVVESIRFRRERRTQPLEHLPPIYEYADAELAEKVKNQLSYRLGNTLVRRSKSPLGWVILPFAFIRQLHNFHSNRPTDA